MPVVLRWSAGGVERQQRLLLEAEAAEVALEAAPDWLVVNGGATGVYRVAPDEGLLAALRRNLASLTPQERIEARERYKRLQAMPADQRETLRRQWEAYEGLSPEERSRLGAAQRPGTKAPGAAAATPVRK